MGCCASIPQPEQQQQAPSNAPVPRAGAAASPPAAAGNTQSGRVVAVAERDAAAVAAAQAAMGKPGQVKSDLKPQSRYEIIPGAPLGKGHFAVVKKCRDIVTGQICAVKIIEKKEMVKSTSSVVKQEIEILKAVGNHPHVVQLLDHWEDASKHYLVTELCSGGDLFSQIVEHGKYSESEAIRCCTQLAQALKHIHACGITHRDLKPENILLLNKSPDSPLKLADFGLSKLIRGHQHPMRTVCGTWAYCVAAETELRCVDSHGKAGLVQAQHVTRSTVLLDERCAPVGVKAVHTTAASVAPLWTVRDAATGAALFRCTADHKLSFLQRRDSSRSGAKHAFRRVEVRCSDFAEMAPQQREALLAYTASSDPRPRPHDPSASGAPITGARRTPNPPPSSSPAPSSSSFSSSAVAPHPPTLPLLPPHVSSAFPVTVSPPSPRAVSERYVGIEVSSATHRFLLHNSLVTSNCAPEVIQRRPYDSTVDNWTLGVLMYILLSGYHPFDVYGECLLPGTMLARGDGVAVPAEQVKPGTVLAGEDGAMVVVESAERCRAGEGVYEVHQSPAAPSYSVTPKHRLTVRCCTNPSIQLRALAEGEGEAARGERRYVAELTYLDPRLRGFRTESWECHPTDVAPELGLGQLAPAEVALTLREEEEHFAAVAAAAAASAAARAQAQSSRDAPVLEEDKKDSLEKAVRPVLRGTVAEIREQVRRSLLAKDPRSYLVEGQLVEVRARDLFERSEVLRIGTHNPAVSGRRVPIPLPLPLPLSSREQAGSYSKVALGDGQYADAEAGTAAAVVYHLFQPLLSDSPAARASFLTFRHLEPVHSFLGVRPGEDESETGAAGLVVTELHPPASGSDSGITIDALRGQYDQTCFEALLAALHSGAGTVVAFGEWTRDCWTRGATRMEQEGHAGRATAWADGAVSGMKLTVAPAHAHGARGHRVLRVIFAPDPLVWRPARLSAIARAVALAHNKSLELADRFGRSGLMDRIEITRLHHHPAAVDVIDVVIKGDNKRFALACGTLTHNCPEPELLQKIITVSYDFDDPVWEHISSSAKQLIKGLLVLDPAKRLSIDAFLASSWIRRDGDPAAVGAAAADRHNPVVLERLAKFSVGKTKFRAIALAKIASGKFKASISRSRTRNGTGHAQRSGMGSITSGHGGGGISLLPDGTPDYLGLGLGSERAGGGLVSARGGMGMGLGLESVREGLAGISPIGNGNNGNGNGVSSTKGPSGSPRDRGVTFEPSAVSSSATSDADGTGSQRPQIHTRAVAISVTDRPTHGQQGGGGGGAALGESVRSSWHDHRSPRGSDCDTDAETYGLSDGEGGAPRGSDRARAESGAMPMPTIHRAGSSSSPSRQAPAPVAAAAVASPVAPVDGSTTAAGAVPADAAALDPEHGHPQRRRSLPMAGSVDGVGGSSPFM